MDVMDVVMNVVTMMVMHGGIGLGGEGKGRDEGEGGEDTHSNRSLVSAETSVCLKRRGVSPRHTA
jgi:hypothetical protein